MGPVGPDLAAAARVVLALILLWSAAAKIRSWNALPSDLRAFGISQRLAPSVAIVLPGAELAVAVLLVAWWSSPVPGLVAVVLLVVFTVFLLRATARGAPCPCFGAAGDQAAGAAGVVRNGVLAALAVLATGDPHGARGGGAAALAVALGVVALAAVTISALGGHAGARRD
jgi:hypothetical protein